MIDARFDALKKSFAETHGHEADGLVRAPGRVNLIGEHTDYNDGFCLPLAIEHDIRVAWGKRNDRTVTLLDTGMEGGNSCTFSLDDLVKNPAVKWADYPIGCAWALSEAGHELVGCDLVFNGNVPRGSGLSSSAAFEVAVIHALLQAAGIELDGATIATLGQKAENGFVGVNCGILDQLASACCRQNHAMLMDCRSLELQQVPLPEGYAIVIADTGKRRGLVDSAYNERREQCEEGAKALGVSHLRDVSLHGLKTATDAGALSAAAKPRCEHVVAENGRTLAAAACLRAGDAIALGALMDQSHADLCDKFEVTCPELDDMVAIARSLPGCVGSRMTGAGFGGCTVSLVHSDLVEEFGKVLLAQYAEKHSLPAAVYVTAGAPGAGPV